MVEEKNIQEKKNSGVAVQNNANCLEHRVKISAMRELIDSLIASKFNNQIKYKIFTWIDKQKKQTFCRYQAFLKIKNFKKPIRKNFSCDINNKTEINKIELDAWKYINEVIVLYIGGQNLNSIVHRNMDLKKWIDLNIDTYLSDGNNKRGNIISKKSNIGSLIDFFGNMKLTEINENIISELFDYEIVYKNNCFKTALNKIKILKKFLDYAVVKEYIKINPYRSFMLFHFKRLKKLYPYEINKRMPIDNLNVFMAAVWEDIEIRNFCLMMFYTGLRDSDVVNLTKDNIKKIRDMYFFDLNEGKTQKNIVIPIHNAIFENKILNFDRDYLFEYSKRKLEVEDIVDDLCKRLKMLLIKKNIDSNITFYWLRHTYNYYLKISGTDEITRRRLFGKLPSDSLRHYEADDLIRMKEAIDKMPVLNEKTIVSSSDNFKLFSNHQLMPLGSEDYEKLKAI
ncbi:tyrosine-type recombinase/integrase [Candidatus Dependentiae bacterium]|nr:tyrosine-type recombinase/integrase [Candidatus Dependentiae bacterium]